MSADVRQVRLSRKQIASVIPEICHKRRVGNTICPSQVARATAGQDGDWRDLMVDVRIVGAKIGINAQLRLRRKFRWWTRKQRNMRSDSVCCAGEFSSVILHVTATF